MRKMTIYLLFAALLHAGKVAQAQVGSLIWEDGFNNLDNRIKLTGNGSWVKGETQYCRDRHSAGRNHEQPPADHGQAGECRVS